MRTWNNQKVLSPTNRNDRLVATRVSDFNRMNPPMLLGSQVGMDPQKFINEVKYIFGVIPVTGSDR